MKCSEIRKVLEELAPFSCACEWDNPGLLAGRNDKEVKKILIAVDATDEVVEKAVKEGIDMLITHHPLIFRAVKKINDEDFITRRILKLIQHDISYYAMHTNFDSAPGCMADLSAERLGLENTEVLEDMGSLERSGAEVPYGIGKIGQFPEKLTIKETAELVKKVFGLEFVTVYGMEENRKIQRIAVCPGSGGSVINIALAKGAEVLVTGDISHHEGIDAAARNMAVIDGGHYGLEHIFSGFMSRYLETHLEGQVQIREMPVKFPVSFLCGQRV